MESNFEKAKTFNNAFGNKIYDEVQKDIFKDDPKTVDKCLSLVKEEVKELEEAVQNHDMVETADALGDILVVVYGMGAHFGLDLDKIYDQIHKSNMSKICKSKKEAEETVESYKKDDRYDTPAYKKAPIDDLYVVYNESTGKILKSINYKPVDLKWVNE